MNLKGNVMGKCKTVIFVILRIASGIHAFKQTYHVNQTRLVKAPNKFLVFDELSYRNQQSREGTTLALSQEILTAGLIGFLLPFYPLASPRRGDSRWDPSREESFMPRKTQQTEESVEH